MSKRLIFLLLSLLILVLHAGTTGITTGRNNRSDLFRIVFYNVENLFDTVNEPGRDDEDFTPRGARRWTPYRLRHKVNNLFKAIAAASEFEIPALIGLCEVENMHVLKMLAYQTGLKAYNYDIIHRNSGDRRGIDVALLYRPEDFTILDTFFRVIRFPFDTLATTRDILHVKGVASGSDTIHVFVNHWTSRWGGHAVTQRYRDYTASFLRAVTDSILAAGCRSGIIIMGDFNDEPGCSSLYKYLDAKLSFDDPDGTKLYNLSGGLRGSTRGTMKFQGQWYLFDQFIVSGSLLNGALSLRTCQGSVRIFSDDFLLVTDNAWFGSKPFRTYEGFRHTGGFSDHLPVVLDLNRSFSGSADGEMLITTDPGR